MRRRAIAASILASVGILTAGWQIGATTAVAPTSTSGGTAGGTTGAQASPSASSNSTATAAPSSSPTSSATATPTATGLKDGSYTGTNEQTRYGSVQVKVTISSGKITDVTALKLTDQGGRSVQISSYAAPILRQEVISSQSAKVSNVSGATYTTDGYLTSVQSALDQAKS